MTELPPAPWLWRALHVCLAMSAAGYVHAQPRSMTANATAEGGLGLLSSDLLQPTLVVGLVVLCGVAFWQYRRAASLRLAVAGLEQRAERYRQLMHVAPDALAVIDVDANRFVDANEHALQCFDMRREDLLALDPSCVCPPLTLSRAPPGTHSQSHMERALAGEVVRFEWSRRGPEGSEVAAEIRMVALLDPERRLLLVTITDRAHDQHRRTLAPSWAIRPANSSSAR